MYSEFTVTKIVTKLENIRIFAMRIFFILWHNTTTKQEA